MTLDPKLPIYPIGSVARILGCSPKVLRDYEKNGLISPARSEGQQRQYSQEDIEMLTLVHGLATKTGINTAGIKLLLGLWPHLDEEGRGKLKELPKKFGVLMDPAHNETPP
ncbi:MAG: MerR family transcriptional regulator [Polyangia bacterium]|jgi:MerR family transcriptional regulator/heat shock protein HspR|nr:MerR family transcriptional regulator [Polyangia bacterium]